MNTEDIQNFVASNKLSDNKHFKISFKKRDPVFGIIIQANDFAELAVKNFFRVVTLTHLKEWRSTKDMSLSRIFNGSEFTRLGVETVAAPVA